MIDDIMKKATVITYQTARGERVNVTPAQADRMERAGTWMTGMHGDSYTSVFHGAHWGLLEMTDEDIDRIVRGECTGDAPATYVPSGGWVRDRDARAYTDLLRAEGALDE